MPISQHLNESRLPCRLARLISTNHRQLIRKRPSNFINTQNQYRVVRVTAVEVTTVEQGERAELHVRASTIIALRFAQATRHIRFNLY